VSAAENPARGASAAAQNAEVSANVKFAGELRRFLELGAAQLDAAIRESDARVDKLAGAVTAVATDARELETQVQALDSADPAEVQQARQRIRQLAVQLDADVQATVTSLQFYDKLIQRLTHVRDGLAIPSDSTVTALDPARSDWNAMLEQVRSRYSMVEERVLFDFMMRGLSADQMLKALTGLRAAAAPGELEVF
jgi:septal ring factor EnvC (AmiA/AmiB activator)